MIIPFFSPGETLATLHFCFHQNGQPLIPTMDTTPASTPLTAVCMRHMTYLYAVASDTWRTTPRSPGGLAD